MSFSSFRKSNIQAEQRKSPSTKKMRLTRLKSNVLVSQDIKIIRNQSTETKKWGLHYTRFHL